MIIPREKSGVRPLAQECTELIREMIDSGCHILNVAEKFNVSESTIRKIINGRAISHPLRKRIEELISSGTYLSNKEGTRIAKLTKCYEMYRDLGTLQAVANELGITRERVRQLLVKGTKLNLFKYTAREYPYISQEKILEDYRSCLSKTKVARMNKVSLPYFNTLLLAYSLDDGTLNEIKLNTKKNECIRMYQEFEKQIGRALSTTDLQNIPKYRALYSRICRYWGNIEKFRTDNSIDKPVSCSMTFRERIQPWIDHRVRIATIRRMQDIDSIKDALSDYETHSISDVAEAANVDPNRARNLLGILIRAGHVEKVGEGFNTKYRLIS